MFDGLEAAEGGTMSKSNADCLIFRLRHWPQLPAASRTADVLRMLSVMSIRPLNRKWMLDHSNLRAQQLDQLIQRLVAEGAIDVTDPSRFAASAGAQPPPLNR